MPDYKMMYHILCAAASEALDALPEESDTAAGRDILQNALSHRKSEENSRPPLARGPLDTIKRRGRK